MDKSLKKWIGKRRQSLAQLLRSSRSRLSEEDTSTSISARSSSCSPRRMALVPRDRPDSPPELPRDDESVTEPLIESLHDPVPVPILLEPSPSSHFSTSSTDADLQRAGSPPTQSATLDVASSRKPMQSSSMDPISTGSTNDYHLSFKSSSSSKMETEETSVSVSTTSAPSRIGLSPHPFEELPEISELRTKHSEKRRNLSEPQPELSEETESLEFQPGPSKLRKSSELKLGLSKPHTKLSESDVGSMGSSSIEPISADTYDHVFVFGASSSSSRMENEGTSVTTPSSAPSGFSISPLLGPFEEHTSLRTSEHQPEQSGSLKLAPPPIGPGPESSIPKAGPSKALPKSSQSNLKSTKSASLEPLMICSQVYVELERNSSSSKMETEETTLTTPTSAPTSAPSLLDSLSRPGPFEELRDSTESHSGLEDQPELSEQQPGPLEEELSLLDPQSGPPAEQSESSEVKSEEQPEQSEKKRKSRHRPSAAANGASPDSESSDCSSSYI